MITEIHFVHAVTVPGTQMRQTEFRMVQGWLIRAADNEPRAHLFHHQHGSFEVVGVGYSVSREEEQATATTKLEIHNGWGVQDFIGKTTADPESELGKAAPHRVTPPDPTDDPANLTARMPQQRGGKKNR